MRDILLILHILAVAVWIGAATAEVVVTPRMTKRGGDVASAWMSSVETMGKVLYTPAGILALATGIGLVIESPVYEFEQAFVSIGFVAVVVGAVIGMRVLGPKSAAAAAAYAAQDKTTGDAIQTAVLPYQIGFLVLMLGTVAAMVGRWGA